jgi:flagellar basal-body rod protein FlgF
MIWHASCLMNGMDNGIYIALARQTALFRDMAVTTNNLSNANTTGFQAERPVFSEYLRRDVNRGDKNKMAFANDIASYRSLEDGPRRVTGNRLDVAINGPGFFMVETDRGVRYTRNGSFTLSDEGRLVTQEGYPVLDASSQYIEFPPEAEDIGVGSAGNITVNGEDFGSIGVARFENSQYLNQTVSGMFTSDIDPTIAGEEEVSMAQGMLENSNVQPIIELTRMMEISRNMGSVSKYIETLYDLQRKTTNTFTQQA